MNLRSTVLVAGLGIFSGIMTLFGLQGLVSSLLSLDLSGVVVSLVLVGIFGLVFLTQVVAVAED